MRERHPSVIDVFRNNTALSLMFLVKQQNNLQGPYRLGEVKFKDFSRIVSFQTTICIIKVLWFV